jgi:type II secretory ATPase GspE/PulE/Tfp pilus assembly ATPase PilB-like protein
VCPKCAVLRVFTVEEQRQLGLAGDSHEQARYRAGDGCDACRKTAYRGRVAICELLAVDEAIRARIQARASASENRDSALAGGMRLLRDDGVQKILAGVTTPSEVARVTVRTDL